jgi:UDP-N-acetylmuramoyl-tripeptide--D-alanyl-D-alanine ligase
MEIEECRGVTVINDAYNANPASVKAAIDTLAGRSVKGKKVIVLGDMLELGSETKKAHYEVGRLAAAGAEILMSVGEWKDYVTAGACDGGMNEQNVMSFDTPREAGDRLNDILLPGDCVLIKASRRVGLEEALVKLKSAKSGSEIKVI